MYVVELCFSGDGRLHFLSISSHQGLKTLWGIWGASFFAAGHTGTAAISPGRCTRADKAVRLRKKQSPPAVIIIHQGLTGRHCMLLWSRPLRTGRATNRRRGTWRPRHRPWQGPTQQRRRRRRKGLRNGGSRGLWSRTGGLHHSRGGSRCSLRRWLLVSSRLLPNQDTHHTAATCDRVVG